MAFYRTFTTIVSDGILIHEIIVNGGIRMASYIILGILALLLLFIISHFRPARTHKIKDSLFAVSCGFVNFLCVKN